MLLGIVCMVFVCGLENAVCTENETYPGFVQSTLWQWFYSYPTSPSPKSQVSEESGGSRSNDPAIRPIDKGLQPLYKMVKEFLNLVQPDSKDDWIDDPRFDHIFDDGNGRTVIYESLNDWRFWSRHYMGFSVCVVVGALFVVVLPIAGLFFCCCRTRGHCGAKRKRKSEKSDGCKRGICGIVLIVLTTLTAAGMVCAFLTNELMRKQTSAREIHSSSSSSSADAGLLPTVIASLRRIESYRSRTFGELRTGVILPIMEQMQITRQQLLDFPDQAREKLSTLTDSRSILRSATALASSLEEISSNIGLIQTYVESFVRLQNQLSRSLNESKANILSALPDGCQFVDECRRLKSQVNSLNTTIDFTQGQNIPSQLTAIRSVIDDDFRRMIEEGKMKYINISEKLLDNARDTIRDKVSSFLKDFDKRIDVFLNDAKKLIENLNSDTRDSIPINDTANVLQKTVMPRVKEYGEYRYYVGIGLSCVLVILVLFNCVGLCFGLCGEAPGDDARTCNRGVGASFLLAGVGVTFLFFWLLMAVVVVLFVVGGASYTEVCRPAVLRQNKAFMKVGERYLASQLNKTKVQFTILTLLSSCEDDEGIFEAMNLEQATNLTGHFDNLRNLVRSSIDPLRDQIKPNLSDVVIASEEVLDALDLLKNANIDDVNFASFEALLNQPITNANLSSLAEELLEASKNPYLNVDQSQTLVRESQRLQNLSRTIIAPMINILTSLREVLTKLKAEIEPQPGAKTFANHTQDLITALTEMQDFIRSSLPRLIADYILSVIQKICDGAIAFMNNLQWEIRKNIGRCRVLYDEFKVITFSVCQSFLSPFNGFWFSFGWCLFFGIPSLIFSVQLAELYRKADEGYTTDSKSFDDPSRSLLRKRFKRK